MLTLAGYVYSDPNAQALGNQGNAMKLLVVEDEADLVTDVQQALERLG